MENSESDPDSSGIQEEETENLPSPNRFDLKANENIDLGMTERLLYLFLIPLLRLMVEDIQIRFSKFRQQPLKNLKRFLMFQCFSSLLEKG
jgi:hypothetical protein